MRKKNWPKRKFALIFKQGGFLGEWYFYIVFININLLNWQSVYDKTQTVFNRGHIDSLLYLSESVFTDLKTFS